MTLAIIVHGGAKTITEEKVAANSQGRQTPRRSSSDGDRNSGIEGVRRGWVRSGRPARTGWLGP